MKLKFLLALVPSISLAATATVKRCGLENNMVDIYSLNKYTGRPDEQWGVIATVDKTQIKRYTLWESSVWGSCKIVFYFKDGSFDNTQNNLWQGYKHQYISYFKEILGLDYIEE